MLAAGTARAADATVTEALHLWVIRDGSTGFLSYRGREPILANGARDVSAIGISPDGAYAYVASGAGGG